MQPTNKGRFFLIKKAHQMMRFFYAINFKVTIIEKGGEISTLFVPNLTINLTYLCYGNTKLLVL